MNMIVKEASTSRFAGRGYTPPPPKPPPTKPPNRILDNLQTIHYWADPVDGPDDDTSKTIDEALLNLNDDDTKPSEPPSTSKPKKPIISLPTVSINPAGSDMGVVCTTPVNDGDWDEWVPKSLLLSDAALTDSLLPDDGGGPSWPPPPPPQPTGPGSSNRRPVREADAIMSASLMESIVGGETHSVFPQKPPKPKADPKPDPKHPQKVAGCRSPVDLDGPPYPISPDDPKPDAPGVCPKPSPGNPPYPRQLKADPVVVSVALKLSASDKGALEIDQCGIPLRPKMPPPDDPKEVLSSSSALKLLGVGPNRPNTPPPDDRWKLNLANPPKRPHSPDGGGGRDKRMLVLGSGSPEPDPKPPTPPPRPPAPHHSPRSDGQKALEFDLGLNREMSPSTVDGKRVSLMTAPLTPSSMLEFISAIPAACISNVFSDEPRPQSPLMPDPDDDSDSDDDDRIASLVLSMIQESGMSASGNTIPGDVKPPPRPWTPQLTKRVSSPPMGMSPVMSMSRLRSILNRLNSDISAILGPSPGEPKPVPRPGVPPLPKRNDYFPKAVVA